MRANWFIGVPLPATSWFEALPPPPRGFRRFHPDDLHFTVAFLGPVTGELAQAAFAHAEPFSREVIPCTLGAVVPMGAARRYSALSAELDRGRDELARAIERVRDAICDAAQARRDTRKVRPHATLARPARNATNEQRREGLAWARSLRIEAGELRLERIALYTWSEQRTERLFRIVNSLAFAG